MKPLNPNPIKSNTPEPTQSSPNPNEKVFSWETVTATTFEWIYWNDDTKNQEVIFYFEELKKENQFQSHVAHGLRITHYDPTEKKVSFFGHSARFLTPTDLYLKLQNVPAKSILKITYLGDTPTPKGSMKVFDVKRFVSKVPYDITKMDYVPEMDVEDMEENIDRYLREGKPDAF